MFTFRLSLLFLSKIFFLLLGYFFILRVIFLIYYQDKLALLDANYFHISSTFISALTLDIITISYILIAVLPLLILFLFLKDTRIITVIRFYIWSVIIFSLVLAIAELGVYGEWEEKPGFEIFTYFRHPAEIFSTNPIGLTVILLLIAFIILYGSLKFLNRFIQLKAPKKHSRKGIGSFFFVSSFLLVIGARGGIQEEPTLQNDAYFSKFKILNDAAVNTTYSFIHSVLWQQRIRSSDNPFKTRLPKSQKEPILAELIQQSSSGKFTRFLTHKRPNIVFVILESWPEDLIGHALNEQEVTPNFNAMATEGILFTNAYSSGTLSQEGIPAILSARPAINNLFITNEIQKLDKLPNIAQTLKTVGYETLYLYGGSLDYGNLTPYIKGSGFDHIFQKIDFPPSVPRSPIGVHDEFAFTKFLYEVKQLNRPFFATMFTLSSHLPYTQPMKDAIHWGGVHKPYLNSVFYTDSALKIFINTIKKEPFYKNTLFIFIADHSHITPKEHKRSQAPWHHTVMMLYGDVIKKAYQGMKIEKIVAQHDLASTILAQMDINHTAFTWSRNVFREDYNPSAYYTFKYGHGFVTPQGVYAYNVKENKVLLDTLPKENNITRLYGEVYMDKLIQIFLEE